MKTLSIIVAAVFTMNMGMAQDQQVRVQSSPDLQLGDQGYSTFYFLDEMDTDTETHLHQGSDVDQMGHTEGMTQDRMDHHEGMRFGTDDVIRDAVLHEMVRRGFEIDAENPDLLVSYKVFDQSTEITGFTEDQAQGTGVGVGVQIQTPQNIEVGEGTILITVTDRESGEMISRGFISEALTKYKKDKDKDRDRAMGEGVYDDQDRQVWGDKDRAKKYDKKVEVIQAVSSIFDQLQLGDTGTLGAGR